MNWKPVAYAAGIGAVAGFIVKDQLTKQPIKPEYALKRAKEAFKQQGPVSGSWIYMKPESFNKNDLNYTVYRGGITRTIDSTNKQFEFYVDAKTGSIIEVVETT
ncbi:PepSY domain-containing protein [Paraliobacillus sediminis]|uniref:PepSY domain-containing protein n=1 Tax=Paraliobacillus sediminis TaxID=1885916 RepID=UPI000E3CDE13|nr:PepSY domain-containing protein [Paraliobacillus sediminis]